MNTEEVQKALADLNTYFVNKVLRADYEMVEYTENVITICIDDKYHFSFWVSGAFYNLSTYQKVTGIPNTMEIEFPNISKKSCHHTLSKNMEDLEARSKSEKIASLKKQLQELER